jgi:hypothetical protein
LPAKSAGNQNPVPFVPSLSKHCFSSSGDGSEKEVQPFDKLRANGK